MAKEGGAEAAQVLHEEIHKHLTSIYPESNVSDWNIVVHVVCNLQASRSQHTQCAPTNDKQGLGTTLQKAGITTGVDSLFAFGRAFSLTKPLFNFIDVGYGKERADYKLREHMRLYVPITQCKHIYFAPCHDTGYLPVLESYCRDQKTASRITLVETRPSEYGFRALGLNMINMPRLFRSEDIVVRPELTTSRSAQNQQFVVPASATMNKTVDVQPTMPVALVDVSTNTASSSWATVGKNIPAQKTISIAAKNAPTPKSCLLNVNDERLDSELPRPDGAAESRYLAAVDKYGKYCNEYHLTGKCTQGDKYCPYHHGTKLVKSDLLVLTHKARSLHCINRSRCRNVDCTFGHVCKFGKLCRFESCSFRETHDTDRVSVSLSRIVRYVLTTEQEPAKRYFEDGTEEWLSAYLNKFKK